MSRTADMVVVGGGVIGLAIALELRRRQPGRSVMILEKEEDCGRHASGRNSGVLHAGFYYTADSLKARFTVTGNRLMTEYCDARGIPVNRCGKLVVARDAGELAGLDELHRRGRVNGVRLEMLDEATAREIEPRARTYQRALWSPTTSSVDPGAVVEALVADARAAGVQVLNGTRFLRRNGQTIETTKGRIEPGYLVNAAGLYADRVAAQYGFGKHYRILPFKGLYLYSDEPAGSFRTNIYPVPNITNPFLGVHFTVTVDGRAKIGPTATPAFWREHYTGLRNFRLPEFVDVVGRQARLFGANHFGFRRLAIDELRKHNRGTMVRLAQRLATGVQPRDWRRWGHPGIRAQLLDTRTNRLEMDFHVEGDRTSFHVLNAVSPGFTCALPFAAHVADRIEALLP